MIARTPVCEDMVKLFESLRTKPYRDAVGILTVGWGHVLLPGEEVREYTVLECRSFLLNDLDSREAKLYNYLVAQGAKVEGYEMDALLSFAFNVGVAAVVQSTLMRMYLKGQRVQAASQFGRWVHAGGQVLRGLQRRRACEAVRFLGGDFDLVRAMWGNNS